MTLDLSTLEKSSVPFGELQHHTTCACHCDCTPTGPRSPLSPLSPLNPPLHLTSIVEKPEQSTKKILEYFFESFSFIGPREERHVKYQHVVTMLMVPCITETEASDVYVNVTTNPTRHDRPPSHVSPPTPSLPCRHNPC